MRGFSSRPGESRHREGTVSRARTGQRGGSTHVLVRADTERARSAGLGRGNEGGQLTYWGEPTQRGLGQQGSDGATRGVNSRTGESRHREGSVSRARTGRRGGSTHGLVRADTERARSAWLERGKE